MTNPNPTAAAVVLVITGPVGSGKSSVLEAASKLLQQNNFPHAAVDMDYLRVGFPRPQDDPFGARAGWRNLGLLWPDLLADGARCLLLADVVEDRVGYLADCAAALPGAVVMIVRLDVPMPLVLHRIEAREGPDTVEWYRQRAPQLQRIMERGQVEDELIDVQTRTSAEVAAELLQRSTIG
ncbi:MAG: hypothetical protein M3Y77_12470 [Actinomycetota bacterium]|nr:hypothetical protein [Actinomycetota bacterium]